MIPMLENLLVKTPDNRIVIDDAAWQTARITARQTHPVWARFEALAKESKLSDEDTVKLLAVAMLDMSVALAESLQKIATRAAPGPIIIPASHARPEPGSIQSGLLTPTEIQGRIGRRA